MKGFNMHDFITITVWNLFAVAALMILGWVISLAKKNVTIADSLWGLGFILIAWMTFILSEGFNGRKWLIAILVTIWGIRLSAYLSWRNWGKGEDPRYGSWRQNNPEKFWIISLFKVFLLQSLFLWLISMALQFGQISPVPPKFILLDIFGTVIFAIGFFFESVGDWQLARFKSDPGNKGKVMDRGLWAYSRHPNYFGEILIWWGIYVVTLSTPGSWWTILSPIIITLVLIKMTGIPLTEKAIAETRPGYKDYVERTHSLLPWFPRKKKNETTH
jgi:steroid 5-alpha reductase family enzyme